MRRRDFLKRASFSVISSGVSLALLNTITSCGSSSGGESSNSTSTNVEFNVPQNYSAISLPDKIEPDTLPYPSKGLDPDVAGDVAYLATKIGLDAGHDAGCMYGTFASIIFGLRDAFKDDPDNLKYYAAIPTYMAIYGKAGVVGWGSVCGACNGCALGINLVAKLADKGGLINNAVLFYTENPMPGNKLTSGMDFYTPSQFALTGKAASGEEERANKVVSWLANAPSVVKDDVEKILENGSTGIISDKSLKVPGDKELGADAIKDIMLHFSDYLNFPVPHTCICHASVNRFLEANNYEVTYGGKTVTLYPASILRAERCSRLVGTMAKFAVMLLNTKYAPDAPAEWKIADMSAFIPDNVNGVTKEVSECLSCHNPKGGAFDSTLGFPRTLKFKGNSCTICHGLNSSDQPRLYPQAHNFWDLHFKG